MRRSSGPASTRCSACLGNFDLRPLHLQAPARNGFLRARDTDAKMARSPRPPVSRDCCRNENPTNSGAVRMSSGTRHKQQNAWWSTQLSVNVSPPQNSRCNGKITGNSVHNSVSGGFSRSVQQILLAFDWRFPVVAKTGNEDPRGGNFVIVMDTILQIQSDLGGPRGLPGGPFGPRMAFTVAVANSWGKTPAAQRRGSRTPRAG